MLEVFRDSGFEIRSKSAGGCVDVQLSLVASAAGVSRPRKSGTAWRRRPRFARCSSRGPSPSSAPRAIREHRPPRARRADRGRLLGADLRRQIRTPPEIAGLKAYASARDLPAGVDLAVVAVPAPAVLGVVDDCAAAGITSLVVITAGLCRSGRRGPRAAGAAHRQGPRLRHADGRPQLHGPAERRSVGPPQRVVLAGLSAQRTHRPALAERRAGIAIIELAAERRLGLSTFVSVGNKADVSGNDLLEYWEGDPRPHVILLYLESFGNPRRFARLARRIGRTKPIVAVKAGRTRAGSRAAGSHTAALAASDVAVDALFHQSGVIRADTIDEMFDIAACLDAQPLPPGRRVAIVTNAGGPGILAADACDAAGLTLTELSAETRARLAACLPATASFGNPIDMMASAGADEYRQTIETMLTAPEVDSLIVIFTPVDIGSAAAIVQAIRDGVAAGRRAGATDKPVLACMMAERGRPVPLEAGGERLPAYAFPENAARALGKATAYAEWRRQTPGLLWGFDDLHVDDARAICREAFGRRRRGLVDRRGGAPRAERVRPAAGGGRRCAHAGRRRRAGGRHGIPRRREAQLP